MNINKRVAFFFLASVILIYAVALTAIFLIFPSEALDCAQFYVSLAFFLTANIAAAVYMFALLTKPQIDRAIVFSPLVGAFAVWNVLYLIAGVLFTVFLVRIGIVIAVDIVLAAAYLIRMWSYALVSGHVTEQREKREDDVRYMDAIRTEVELCAETASDREVKGALQTLSDDVRFSDHISYGALRGIECDLLARVRALRGELGTAPKEELLKEIDGIRVALRERNARCLALK